MVLVPKTRNVLYDDHSVSRSSEAENLMTKSGEFYFNTGHAILAVGDSYQI